MTAVLAGAASTAAQQGTPVTLDPNIAGQNTTLVLSAYSSLLGSNGTPASSLSLALARGIRVDPASRAELCTRSSALAGTCPDASRIGFGRFAVMVRGYQPGGGETEVAWAIDAYLGKPLRSGDAGSVVLISKLLGADLIAALLTPSLDGPVPPATTTIGRLVRRSSGRYGVELSFDKLPAQLAVSPPVTASPSSLELSLGAVRRVRQNFIRRFKIRTPTGYEIRKVRDHRLVGHNLFRAAATCKGSWPAELSVGFAGRLKRTATRMPCREAVAAAAQTPAR